MNRKQTRRTKKAAANRRRLWESYHRPNLTAAQAHAKLGSCEGCAFCEPEA